MADKLFGRYEVKSELGRGGMAVVYHAYDPRFERDVAIKVLPRELLFEPQFRARFEREAKTIAALEHAAIVPVYDYGEEEGQLYLVMRYMSGGSLEDRIKHGVLPLDEVALLVGHLAPALDKAHARGVIHRDLKPGNILFDNHGDPHLADFGIAKLTESATTLTGGAIIGTPAYMSPEQARGDADIDGRSDLYSLGAIVYQMLTGKLPYQSTTPTGQIVKHITEPVPNILLARPDLPVSVQAVIGRAMAKDKSERYSSVAEMATALKAAAAALSPATAQSHPVPVEPAPTQVAAPQPAPSAPPAAPTVAASAAAVTEVSEKAHAAVEPPTPGSVATLVAEDVKPPAGGSVSTLVSEDLAPSAPAAPTVVRHPAAPEVIKPAKPAKPASKLGLWIGLGAGALLLLLLVGGGLWAVLGGLSKPAPTATTELVVAPPPATQTQPPAKTQPPVKTQPPAKTQPPTAPPPTGKVTITFWSSDGADAEAFLDKLIGEFQKQNPQIQVQHVTKSMDTIVDEALKAAPAGQMPDVMRVVGDQIGPLTRNQLLAPVDPLKNADLVGHFTSDSLNQATLAGKLWGVPDNYGNHVMLLFNRDLLPQPPKTFEELEAIAQKLNATGKIGLAFPLHDPFFSAGFYGAFGGWPLDAQNKPQFNNPAFNNYLGFIQQLKQDGIVDANCDYGCMDANFRNGQAAMIINGDWALLEYQQALGDKLLVAPVPPLNGQKFIPMTSGKYYLTARQVQDDPARQAAVLTFIRYMTSTDVQRRWLNEMRRLPSDKEVTKEALSSNDVVIKGAMQALQDGRGMSPAPQMQCVWDTWKGALGQVLSGATPADVAASAQTMADQCAAKFK
jgi:maltose-binding protein MalE/predicted Ser/Thr protein kinase